jgi:hypothetical protein
MAFYFFMMVFTYASIQYYKNGEVTNYEAAYLAFW